MQDRRLRDLKEVGYDFNQMRESDEYKRIAKGNISKDINWRGDWLHLSNLRHLILTQ